MQTFPATQELIRFCLAVAAAWIALSRAERAWRLFFKLRSLILVLATERLRFPRRLIAPGISTLPPVRARSPDVPLGLLGLLGRFKFTASIFSLNVYTFMFTNDFLWGDLNSGILYSRGFSYENFSNHRWFILLTSNFIHFHLLHLCVNMLMLLIFSGSLELLMGARFAGLAYAWAMNANIPNGILLLPILRMHYPGLWNETVQYVDVGASLGVLGSIGALARLMIPRVRWLILGLCVLGTVGGSLYIHNLFGIDHACSAVMGYLTAAYLLKKKTDEQSQITLALATDPQREAG